MKIRQWQWWIIVWMMAFVMSAYADNPCTEGGPYTNNVSCIQGTLLTNYVLAPTSISTVVGKRYNLPTALNLVMTNSSEQYSVTYDCSPWLDTNIDQSINYTFGNVYLPGAPAMFWTPGTYNFSAQVDVNGSLCGPVTETLGDVTINVVSNSPDVLLNIDFGGALQSSELGYAAIGDSAGDIWNYYAPGNNAASGCLLNLITADGYSSPIAILVTNLLTAGTNGSTDAMYNDFLATNGQTETLTITNLPSGVWNIYLYSDDGNFDLTVQDTNNNIIADYGTETCYDLPLSSPLAWQSGIQYVVYPNVTLGSSQTLTVTVAPGQSGVALISGLQIASTSHSTGSPVPLPGMVAWWRAEGNYVDSVGANNGTPENGTGFMPGEVGTAFSFNGVKNIILVTNSSLNVGASAGLTIEGWIKPVNLNSPMILCEFEGSNSEVGVQFVLNVIPDDGEFPGALAANILDTMGDNHILGTATNPVAAGVWNHVALTYDKPSGIACLYVNGALAQQTTFGGFNPQTSKYKLVFGGNTLFGSLASPSDVFSGGMDEFGIYNRALSSGEITAIYDNGSIGKILDPMLDTDYDGVSDLQELADRTNPNDPDSVLQVCLGYWSFDNTNTWVGNAGQLPIVVSNVFGVSGWSTNAAWIDNTNGAVLCYRDVETNGNANINLRDGTVKIWFKPDWSSTNVGGVGPGTMGRLIEMGQFNPVMSTNGNSAAFTNGWWALYFSPDGTQLSFGSSTNGGGGVNLSASIAWISNQWHQVVLTYSPSNSSLYLDGRLTASGAGSIFYPNLTERSMGFRIGSDRNGKNQAAGTFDELETFNFPLASNWVAMDFETYLGLLPVIEIQPVDQTVIAGSTATFSVWVGGPFALTYQWYFDSSALPGETNATLTINNAQSGNIGNYHVVVADSAGVAVSSNAELVLLMPPSITAQPANQAVAFGGQAIFSVSAAGSDPMTYQWQKNGHPLSNGGNVTGANTNTLSITDVSSSDAGVYTVQISNAAGSCESSYVMLRTWSPLNVLGWGLDGNGQIDIPVDLTNAVSVSAGGYHSLAVKTDGTVEAWGLNSFGEITVPAGLSNVVAVAAGELHSLALQANGTVTAWGLDTNGATDVPPQLTNVVEIAAGYCFSLALKNDGTVVGWGDNSYGQINIPSGLTNVLAISAGGYHSLALKNDGTIVGWGNDSYGQIDVPSGLTNVLAISAGGYHSMALDGDGTVVAWGSNTNGQANVPFQLTNIVAIAAGGYHSLALTGDGRVVGWGNNSDGETNIPQGLTNVLALSTGSSHSLAMGNFLPAIVIQPANQIVDQGDNAVFMAGVTGAHLSYQWYFNGSAILGANQAFLSLTNVQYTWAGNYYVTISNSFGAIISSGASLEVSPAQFTIVPSNILDWWPANGNANDVVHSNNGVLQGGATYATGKVGLAFSFNGTNGGMSANGITGLNGNSPHSLEGWIKINQLPSNQAWIMLLGNEGAGSHQWLIQSSGCAQMGVWNGAQAQPTLPVGVWIHLAMTFDGNTLCCYTNGCLQSSQSGSFNFGTNAIPLTLGLAHAGGNYFNGLVDEFSIYGRALSATEVAAIYNASSAGKNNDSDANGLQDAWEIKYFGHIGVDPGADPDGDGLSNIQEFQLGTDPTNPDTDGDGRNDWQEAMDGTDPLDPGSFANAAARGLLADQASAAAFTNNIQALVCTNLSNSSSNFDFSVYPADAMPVIAFYNTNFLSASDVILPDISVVLQNGTYKLTVTGGDPTVSYYQVYAATNVSGPWAWVGQVAPGAYYIFANTSILDPVQLTNYQQYLLVGSSSDDDGDQLPNSFERLVTLTDPENPDTMGGQITDDLQSYNHGGMDNWNQWILPQVAGVYASIPMASQSGGYGAFTITIPPFSNSPPMVASNGVVVSFNLSGTAGATDYSLVDASNNPITTGSITIPPSQSSAMVYVVPNSTTIWSGSKTVILTLTYSTYGDPADPNLPDWLLPTRPATVTIAGASSSSPAVAQAQAGGATAQPQGTGAPAISPQAGIFPANTHPTLTVSIPILIGSSYWANMTEKNPPVPGKIRITRTEAGNPAANSHNLVAHYHLSGTAIYQSGTIVGAGANVDYTILPPCTTNSIIIPAGQSYADVIITPLNDGMNKPAETVVLTLDSSRDYEINTNQMSATNTIDGNGMETYALSVVQTPAIVTGHFILDPIGSPFSQGRPATFLITRTGSVASGAKTSMQIWFSGSAVLGAGSYSVVNNKYDYSIWTPAVAGVMPAGTAPATPFEFTFPTGLSYFYFDCFPSGFKLSVDPGTIDMNMKVLTSPPTAQSASATITYNDPNLSVEMPVLTSVSAVNDVGVVGSTTAGTMASFVFIRDNWFNPLGSPFGTEPQYTILFDLFGQAQYGSDYTISSTSPITPRPDISPNTFSFTMPAAQANSTVGQYSPTITIKALNCNHPTGVASIIVRTHYAPYPAGANPTAALRIMQPWASATFIPDTDGDGLNDLYEINVSHTDPLNPDSFGNGVLDSYSTAAIYADGIPFDWYFQPIVTDLDGDSYSDFQEVGFGTDPSVKTTRTSGAGPTINLTTPSPAPPTVP